jgi:hypothetical protein
MMPMIATTINSSMRVKPFAFFIAVAPSNEPARDWADVYG